MTHPARRTRRAIEPASTVTAQAGAVRPGVAELRLIGPPAVIDAATKMLAEAFPELYQPSTRKPARGGAGDIQYGTLIVPVTES